MITHVMPCLLSLYFHLNGLVFRLVDKLKMVTGGLVPEVLTMVGYMSDDKTNHQNECMQSKYFNQSGHTPSAIRVYAVCLVVTCNLGPTLSSCGQQKL